MSDEIRAERENARAQRRYDLRHVMSSQNGRRVMHAVIASGGIEGPIAMSTFIDAAMAEAVRRQAIAFRNELEAAAPELYRTMQDECKLDMSLDTRHGVT